MAYQIADISTPRFTIEDIRRLMEGIRQGQRYNQQGLLAKPGEDPLTMDQLSKYLTNEKTKGERKKICSKESLNSFSCGRIEFIVYNIVGSWYDNCLH